jgi:hypothetical protein
LLERIYSELENDYHLETNILKKFQDIPDTEHCYKLKAEIMAFQFMENNENRSDWGTYFGSFAQFPQKDGSSIEIPTIKDVDENVIRFWIDRASQTNNPVLKARYSGLVWDFGKKISSIKLSHNIAIIYIKSLIEIVENRLQNEIDLIQKIERAFSVAVSINSKELTNKSKKVMLHLEEEIGENGKPGLWGFSFDTLIENSKSQLTKNEQTKILAILEQRLLEATSKNKINTWASENVINRLAPYYRKRNKIDDAQRVIRIHGDAVKNRKEYAMLLQYQKALKDLQKMYSEYGMKQESDELLKEIKKIGTGVLNEMQTFTSESKITKEEIDCIVIPLTTGAKKEVFHKLIHFFTPRKDLVVDALQKQSKEFFFSNFFGTSIIDETGREVANIGTLEEDLNGNIIHYISQDLQFNSFYSNRIFYRLINQLNYRVEDFMNFIKDSAIIYETRIDVLRKGVQAYFDNDFIVCEHLLIPQIETAIRNLIEQNGGVLLEPSSLDAFQLKTFNKLLLDDITRYSLGEDIQIYFRTLFTDPRGWNLRNRICHGLSEPSASTKSSSERVLHSLLILGTLRRRKTT